MIERRSRTNYWIKANVPSRKQYEEYYHSHINPKTVDLERKTFKFTRRVPGKSYGMKKQRWEDGPSKWTDSKRVRPAMRDVQKSLRPKDTVKKATLSSKPRLPRNQGDQKKKKQYIVANWGGLPLGNGLALGLAGTPTASYGAGLGTGLGTGYNTDLSTGLTGSYGTGLGTMLVEGYGSQGENGVLTNRQTFGTNYGVSSNRQSSPALEDLAGLNSLTSQAGLNYLSNLDSLGGTTDLNSLNSISQYRNSDLDILGNNANAGLNGLSSLTSGTAHYVGNNELGNTLHSLQGKLAGGGNRQGIGCKYIS